MGHDLLTERLDVYRKVSTTTCLAQYSAGTLEAANPEPEKPLTRESLHILHGLILGQLPCKAAIASDIENRRCSTDGCLIYLGRFVRLM